MIVCSILICLWPPSFCVAVCSAYPEKKWHHTMCCLKKAGNKICISFPARISFFTMLQKKKNGRNANLFKASKAKNRSTQWKMVAELLPYHYQAQCSGPLVTFSHLHIPLPLLISPTFVSSPPTPPLPPPLPSSSPDKPWVFSKESEH